MKNFFIMQTFAIKAPQNHSENLKRILLLFLLLFSNQIELFFQQNYKVCSYTFVIIDEIKHFSKVYT